MMMISVSAPAHTAGHRLGFTALESEISIADLPVTGAIPPWLNGTLVRNGPARFAVGDRAYRHWFDGLAMLHRFTIGEGRVSYANRFLRSAGFVAAERTGRIARSEFATDPRRSLLDRVTAPFGAGASDNANVNVVPFGEGYLALTETPAPVLVDRLTLATRGPLAYDDDVAGQITTAHTLHDEARGATFNLVIDVGRKSTYKVVRIADGQLRRTVVGTVSVDAPAYIHAFSMTDRYVIIVEYPLLLGNPLALLFQMKPYIDNYAWKPERGTRFHVIDKDTGANCGSYDAPAFFAFHHVNAFDEADTIVIDIAAFDDAGIIGDFMLDRLCAPGQPNVANSTVKRFRLRPGQSAASCEILSTLGTELPRIAPRCAGKPYRFAYGITNAPDGSEIFDRIVKLDVGSRSVQTWMQSGAYVGEPIFVPRPGGSAEDDGVLLTVVLDAPTATSFLLVLDARTLEEYARVGLPHHIPFGFHGMFR